MVERRYIPVPAMIVVVVVVVGGQRYCNAGFSG